MNRVLVQSFNGKVVNKFLPDVYEDGQFMDEENVNIIGLDIEVNNKKVRLIKPRNSSYSDLLVEDKVILNKYLLKCDYEDYIYYIKKYINEYYSAFDEIKKEEEIVKYYCTKNDFLRKNKNIIEYEIEF